MSIKDGNWELIEYDSRLKRSKWHYFDGRQHHYRISYETSSIMESNLKERNDTYGQKWGEWRKVASIPVSDFYRDLSDASLQKDDKYISKYLNDSDNKKYRTFEGNV